MVKIKTKQEYSKEFEIKHLIENKMQVYSCMKKTKKIGSSCHVLLPKELLGKLVRVKFELEDQEE